MRTTLALALPLAVAACGGTPATSGTSSRSIDLALASPSAVFVPGDEVKVKATVTRAGKQDATAAVTFEADPPASATLASQFGQEAVFTLATKGSVNLTACVEGSGTCDSLALVVDDGSPQVTVTEPLPGAEIDDAAGVTVRGTATDGTGALQVFVNGRLAALDGQGAFSAVLPPRFGIEHVEVVASDGLTEPTAVELDVMHAAAFTPATVDGKPQAKLDDAAGLWLGQRFFDDGERVDPVTRPIVTHDLADLVQLAAGAVSLDGALPDPLVTSDTITLSVPSAELGAPATEINLQDGGMDLFVRYTGLKLATAGTMSIAGQPHSLEGTVNGSVLIHALVKVSKPDPESEVEATVSALDVTLESLAGQFKDPAVTALFALSGGFLRSTIEAQLKGTVGALLESTLPSLLEGFLSSLDHALDGLTLPIDSPPLPKVTLQMDGRVSRVEITRRTALVAPLGVTVSSDVAATHPGSRGVARVIAPGPLEFLDSGQMQLGVSAAFLNGVLHVLWASGLLDLDLAAVVPAAGALLEGGRLDPRLPPVLRPPREGDTTDLVLQLGQLELVAAIAGQKLHYAVNLEVGADLVLDAGKLRLALVGDPEVKAWPLPDNESKALSPQVVAQALIFGWPELSGALGSLVAIDLPLAPAGGLGGLSPDLANLQLEVKTTDERLFARGESLLIPAEMTGTLP